MPGNKKRKNLGFTLMEMVVVIAVFSVLVLIALNVFILALHAQRQTSARQQTLANLRYVMESMAQKVRTSEIDYGYYNSQGLNVPINILALIDQTGNELRYSLESGEIKLTQETAEGDVSFNLTDLAQVTVLNFDIYLKPTASPFAEERCNAAAGGQSCVGTATCTLDDSGSGNYGFCRCSSNDDCQNKNCDSSKSLCLPPNFQPRATIVLGFQSSGVRPEEQKTIYLQTTVSSRVYKR